MSLKYSNDFESKPGIAISLWVSGLIVAIVSTFPDAKADFLSERVAMLLIAVIYAGALYYTKLWLDERESGAESE